jgi:hypothetical protein
MYSLKEAYSMTTRKISSRLNLGFSMGIFDGDPQQRFLTVRDEIPRLVEFLLRTGIGILLIPLHFLSVIFRMGKGIFEGETGLIWTP